MDESSNFLKFVDSLASRQTVYETLDFIALWSSGLVRAQYSSIILFVPPPAESVRTLARSSDERDGGIDHAINTMAGGWSGQRVLRYAQQMSSWLWALTTRLSGRRGWDLFSQSRCEPVKK